MKLTVWCSRICGILAAVFLTMAVAIAAINPDGPARVLSVPEDAQAVTDTMMDAVCRGDYLAAGSMMYGKPDLGADQIPESPLGRLLWDSYLESVSYDFFGGCYALDSGIARDVRITALDIPAVTEALNLRAQELLEQELESEQADDSIFDENGILREDYVSQIMCQAAREVLDQGDYRNQTTVTLRLIHEDGSWWVLPDQALIRAISGGVAG